jgi:hypothetical protein
LTAARKTGAPPCTVYRRRLTRSDANDRRRLYSTRLDSLQRQWTIRQAD